MTPAYEFLILLGLLILLGWYFATDQGPRAIGAISATVIAERILALVLVVVAVLMRS